MIQHSIFFWIIRNVVTKLARNEAAAIAPEVPATVSQATLEMARKEILAMHMAPTVEEYIVQLINATRRPAQYNEDLSNLIEYGASPRATIALDRCARAYAWLQGKDFVSPDDVQAVIHDCLRHRLILTFEAEATGVNSDQAIDKLIAVVPLA
jgi:MoxR-like ATPase